MKYLFLVFTTATLLMSATKSFAQTPFTVDVTYTLACKKDEFNCRQIKVSNFKVYNLSKPLADWNGLPLQITFDVVDGEDFVGARTVSLPLESKSIKGNCNLPSSRKQTSRNEIYNDGIYLLDSKTQWGTLPTHEFLKFEAARTIFDGTSNFSVNYSHSILCFPTKENNNQISFRFSGNIN